MKKILYFAYGSNLKSDRLTERVGKVQYYSNHILNNYKLVFNCDGFANIMPSEGDHVEGALYVLNSDQIHKLSRYEGCYKLEFFDVDEYTVVVYIGLDYHVFMKENQKYPTRLDYLNVILDGCIEKGLKYTYNKVLEVKTSLFKNIKSKHKPWL